MTGAPPTGWTARALADPHHDEHKPARVRAMFSAIAASYDLNNRVHSLGRDRAWRRGAVKAAAISPGDRVVDVACGTGDLTLALARAGAAEVVGLDFTPEMLELARRKARRNAGRSHGAAGHGGAAVSFVEGDAQSLPFPDASFDAATIAFGIRNVADPGAVLAEFRRVLRPGGRAVILEFDRPGFWPARVINSVYCGRVMPVTATLISGDRSGAYRYLPRSVGTFLRPADLRGLLATLGFEAVGSRSFTMGICVCTSGRVPG